MNSDIEALRRQLAAVEEERTNLLRQIAHLSSPAGTISIGKQAASTSEVSTHSGPHLQPSALSRDEKVATFRFLFRGREDVYAIRFESKRTGRGGYQPACKNDWVPGICGKPRMKCPQCPNRELLPLRDADVLQHLIGHMGTRKDRDYVLGLYPLLADETTWFLALDFDKASWMEDFRAFTAVCRDQQVPCAVERSRSGNGAHVWIFFSQPVPAALARKLGAALLTATMEQRPEIGLDSYDRMFPNQDTMPKGGFGNLIALPFQGHAVSKGNTLLLDEQLQPYIDQWAYLKSLKRMSQQDVSQFVAQTAIDGDVLGVRRVATEDADDDPWTLPPSRRRRDVPLTGPLPDKIEAVLANEIYIPKEGLPPALRNRIARLAAFQNPEFYRNQSMRLPTYATPRIIGCAEDHGKHIGLPTGCLDDLRALLKDVGVGLSLEDKRQPGLAIDATFCGKLRPEQAEASALMMEHDTGVLAASTAFGKTVVAIDLIAQRGVNTLILVHRKQLMDQWHERLATFLDLDPKRIGRIGGGAAKPTGVVDIAMIQSLVRKGVVSDSVSNYGHLVVDECHHISAPSFEQVARRCSAKYITGLSATVTRKDGHHPIILMQCGPIRYRTDPRKDAERRPFEHRVIVQETGFVGPGGSDVRIHEVYAALTSDLSRNRMIAADVEAAVQAGRTPVLLTERRDHMDTLVRLLTGRIPHLIVLAGGMGRKQRNATMEQLAAIPPNEGRLLIATGKYLGEGFDDARLDTLFLAMPISWRGTLAQYAGRLHRLHDQKRDVLIHDYADVQVPMLNRMFLKRLSGYHAIGYSVISILPNPPASTSNSSPRA
jgi:superfamily II DNA or RNA helicase